MKYLDSYKDPHAARDFLECIRRETTRPWVLLEVCGGQAHNLLRCGADRDLPESLEIVHGPSCPVSATPARFIDRALAIAERPGVLVAAPGDLLRVPGSRAGDTLLTAQNRGADVRSVYTPLDVLALARKHPEREVVGLAVGFETTAPTAAAALLEAERLGLDNLSLLTSYFRLVPAVETLVARSELLLDAAVVSGPVAAVTGLAPFASLAERFEVPIVVTGPEAVDLLDAIARAVRCLERGKSGVENQYARAVRPDGNIHARASIDAVFETTDADWRGLGRIAGSGLTPRKRFRRFDADARYPLASSLTVVGECRDGEVIAGRLKPPSCPAFGCRCTPTQPLGAAMVSAEGSCAAYYRFRSPNEADSPAVASSTPLALLPSPALPGR